MNLFNVADQYMPQKFYLRRRMKPKAPPPDIGEMARGRKDETAECIALNHYLMHLEKHCEFTYTFSGNGGLRNRVVAMILKACGLRAGVWDYYFRAPNKPTHWLEMKFGKNNLSDKQKDWREKLLPLGDTFSVAWTAEEALKQLVDHGIIPQEMVFFGPRAVALRLQPPIIEV